MASNTFSGAGGSFSLPMLDIYGTQTTPDGGIQSTGSGVNDSNTILQNNLQGQIYSDPQAALNLWMDQKGFGAGNVNSPFYNFLSALAPGAQLMSIFTDPNAFGPSGVTDVLGDFNSYFNQGINGGSGAMGNAQSAISSLLGGGGAGTALGDYIDALDPNEIMKDILTLGMAGSQGGYGDWAQQAMKSASANLMNQWQAAMGGALGTGASSAAAFRDWMSKNGQSFLNAFGL